MNAGNEQDKITQDQVAQIYKETYIQKTTNLIAGVVLFIPIAAIWAGFYFLILTKPFFVQVEPNIRGVIIIAVVIIPLLAAAVLRNVLKNYIVSKYFSK